MLIFYLEKISINRKNKLENKNEINKTDYTVINKNIQLTEAELLTVSFAFCIRL